MPQSKGFRFGYGLLLAFLIIYVGIKIDFIFHPLFILVNTLFFPFLVCHNTTLASMHPTRDFGSRPGIPTATSFKGLNCYVLILAGRCGIAVKLIRSL